MLRLRFKLFLFVLSFTALAAALRADADLPVRHAITFEPLVLDLGYSPTMGPLSYHYSVNRFFSLSGLTQLTMRETETYFAARWGIGLGFTLWLPSTRPFQGLFLSKKFDLANTWVIDRNPPAYGDYSGDGFSLNQTTEAGYQWSIHDYLIAPRLRFTAFTSVDAVSLSIGRAW